MLNRVFAPAVQAGRRRHRHPNEHAAILNRQLIYCPADEGRCKVDAAAVWIKSRNPSAAVRSIPRMLTAAEALISLLQEGVSLLVVAADCGLRTASCGPLLEPADLPAYAAELESGRDRSPVPKASRSMTASFGPTNAIAASYLARDIVSWFAGSTS